jgi:hypothetical protein
LGTSGSELSEIKIYSTASIVPTAVPATACLNQSFALEGVAVADRVSSVTPPGTLGNISINDYILARDILTLHFCNPNASDAVPPRGVHSVLAIH